MIFPRRSVTKKYLSGFSMSDVRVRVSSLTYIRKRLQTAQVERQTISAQLVRALD